MQIPIYRKAFSNMTDSMGNTLESTSSFLKQTGSNADTNLSLLTDTGKSVKSLKD